MNLILKIFLAFVIIAFTSLLIFLFIIPLLFRGKIDINSIYKKIFPFKNYQPFSSVWNDKNKKGESYIKLAEQLLIDSNEILRSMDVEMIPVYGTLLGFIRHKGLIPWDDDIDVAIPKNKFHLILDNKEEFKKKNIGVYLYKTPVVDFIKLFVLSEPKIKGEDWSWPFIDVFGYNIKGNKIIIENNEFGKSEYPFDLDDVFPLRSNYFETTILAMPNKPDEILKKFYKDDWETTCISASYNHKQERRIKKSYMAKCEDLKLSFNENIFDNVWVINLESRPDRWDKSKERLEKIGIKGKKWLATDAKNEDFKNFYKTINTNKTISEIACYMSHFNLWEYLYNNDIDMALIFEDDLIFPPNITKEDIKKTMEESIGFEILYLGHCYSSISPFSSSMSRIGTAQCLHAYIITKKAIEKLMKYKNNYHLAIDKITEKFCENNICYLAKTVKNPDQKYGQGIVLQDEDLGSNINKNKLKKVLDIFK